MINQRNKYILQLLLIYVLLLVVGIALVQKEWLGLTPEVYAGLLTSMTGISLGVYLLINAGMKRNEQDRGIFLLAGLGGKFLAYLILLLLFWAVGKNLTKDFIIVFFVLYLLLTFFILRILYKTLKNN